MSDDNQIVQLWRDVLGFAIQDLATDIHIEPGEEATLIRFRVDGVLHAHRWLESCWHDHLIAHIKILARLDIAEKRLPQDGRLSFQDESGQLIHCRVSTLPTLSGEKIVVRVLHKPHGHLGIASLGFDAWQLEKLSEAVSSPQGLILVTGPTGSGKTITLYSCLAKLNDGSRNISTVEDPAEIYLSGTNQVSINEKSGLGFANTLRALLRQDPDVIMIGEIRDAETAKIALQAAQTGHLVLATLHTNDAIGALSRLVHLGCDLDLIAGTVHCITAQRLVRKFCSSCQGSGRNGSQKICALCRGSCYSGRVAVHEVMPFNQVIRQQIRQGSDLSTIASLAQKSGMKSLFENAQNIVARGISSSQEIEASLGMSR